MMREISEELKNEILKVGTKVATSWGGSCYDFEVFPRKKKVTFHCVENGEFFVTTLTFDDIKSEYNYDIETKYKGVKAKKIEKNVQEISDELYQKLLEVGAEVASLWGANCYDVEVDTKTKNVTFLCNEFGEDFATSMTFAEIENDYKVKIA